MVGNDGGNFLAVRLEGLDRHAVLGPVVEVVAPVDGDEVGPADDAVDELRGRLSDVPWPGSVVNDFSQNS